MTRFKSIPVDELFWSILQPNLDTNACWEWPKGCDDKGYGNFKIDLPDGRKLLKAHRVAWWYAYGYIPQKLFICHTCNNPPCCRPSHLYAATNRDNIRDAVRDGLLPYGRRTNDKNGRWSSKGFHACTQCHSVMYPHKAKGICTRCYQRHRTTTERYRRKRRQHYQIIKDSINEKRRKRDALRPGN